MLNLRAIATLLVLLVSSIAMQIAVGLPCMLFIYPINRWDRRLYGYTSRTLGTLCQAYWVQMVAFVLPKAKLIITGDLPTDKGPKLVLVNHQVDVDWWFAWSVSLATGKYDAGLVKIMLKDSLKYVPIFGWGCWFFGFLFVKRNWQTDSTRVTKTLNEYVEDNLPIWLLMFPEGTTMHREALDSSRAFATKSGRPQLKNVMLPRERGFTACVDAFKDCDMNVYDMTIGYTGYSGEVPTYAMGYGRNHDVAIPNGEKLLNGHPVGDVHIHIKKTHIKSVSSDRVKWIDEQWAAKDALLSHFADHGCFPDSNQGTQTIHQPKGSLGGVLIFLILLAVEALIVHGFYSLAVK
eukprot:c39733_g1_i1.p1 GENE.c39733_g1_i1~~c39733_g1_i1.p1  ORF type:complete len:349 (-),score=68.55 c39733_g1_i1:12-1058(-)